MKMKVNYNVTASKEADVSDCAYEEEEEFVPCLRFPFPFILLERWRNIWSQLKKG
jgi:hypothetical protein